MKLMYINVGRVNHKESYMWMSPKLLSLILMLIILQMMISSCTKLEFDGFDPTTSALKWVLKKGNND